MKTFMLASTKSNSGKTLVTSLLMNILSKEFKIAAFKVGPDYIDPKYHEFVLGTHSYNLDLPIMGIKNVKTLFYNHSKDQDLTIIEGVMGLFDGKVYEKLDSNGSSFELAKSLHIPIILLVDCKSKGQSVLAEILGYLNLAQYKGYNISGIIINRTTERNFEFLKNELNEISSVPILGYIPNLNLDLNSRHLGLIEPFEFQTLKTELNNCSEILAKTVDLRQLIEISEFKRPVESEIESIKPNRNLRVGIAFDEAFNFYYQDNLELLEKLGCELVKFSPIHSHKLPENLNLIYLGGGYPELYLEKLEANKSFRSDLKYQLNNGLACLAECGGLVYLSNKINYDGEIYKGLGIFDCNVEFRNHLVRFGYNQLNFHGMRLNTHEFHYSDTIFKKNPEYLFKINKGERSWRDGIRFKNTIGLYPHIHFYAQPDGFKFLDYILDLADGSNC